MGRKITNSFKRVELFGEEYSIKAPSRIPKLYDLRRLGRVCRLKMENAEWLMQHTNKYRTDSLTQEAILFPISGIVIHADKNASNNLQLDEYGVLGDIIIKATYLKSNNSSQVYVLECYEEKNSKCLMQLVCDISQEIAIPYIIRPNPLPLFESTDLKNLSRFTAAIMLGAKVYINVTKIGRESYDESCEYYETAKSDIWLDPYTLFGRSVI